MTIIERVFSKTASPELIKQTQEKARKSGKDLADDPVLWLKAQREEFLLQLIRAAKENTDPAAAQKAVLHIITIGILVTLSSTEEAVRILSENEVPADEKTATVH